MGYTGLVTCLEKVHRAPGALLHYNNDAACTSVCPAGTNGGSFESAVRLIHDFTEIW